MIYLQNAVYAIKELRSVQTTGSQLALANGTVPTYKDYKALLKLAASTYDRAHATAKHQPTRSAERTDIWDANDTESFHKAYEFGFDIDTPTDIVQAHMHDQSGVIPKETFGQLSPESQKAWSQLSDDVRVDILWALQVNGSQHSQESTHMPLLHDKPRYNQTWVPQNATLNKTVKFNTMDDDATTPSSITMSVHDTSTASTPTPTDPDLYERVRDVLSHIFGEAHADGESDKLIASVTKQAASQHREWLQPKAQDIPAADLHKMVSQPQRPDRPSVTINGVEYIAKLNDVMYQVNHKQTTLPPALIDRGTNGGVTGSDSLLIDKSLHSVHIQGIDDHTIKDVPIGTVGGCSRKHSAW
jgi:hypothetical protein